MNENTLNKMPRTQHQNTMHFIARTVPAHRHTKKRNAAGIYIKLIALCCLLALFSCKAKKQLIVKRTAVADTVVKAASVDPKIAKLQAIKTAQTSFNTFSGKAKTKLAIGNSTNDVTLNIRIGRDKKIWVSVTAIAGIEVARALITPDSILLINRLQSLYVRKPFSYVSKFAGDKVNYKTLESLLIGNAVPELLNENSSLQTTKDTTIVTGNFDDMFYKLIIGADLRVDKTNLDNKTEGQSVQVANSAFILSGNKVVPSQIDMSFVVKDKKILVNLHFTKVDFDLPLEYPFSIPARYEPAQ